MSKFSQIYCATAVSLFLSGSAAFADLTNDEVWDNWQSYMSSTGYSVTANKAASGNVLTVTDIKITVPSNFGSGDMSISLPMMTYTEIGDGSVKIGIPPLSSFSLDTSLAAGEKVEAIISYAQDGMNIIATGDSSDFTYTYTSNSVELSLDKLTVDGEDIGPDIAKASIVVKGISGSSSIKGDGPFDIAQTMTASAVTYDLAFADPDDGGNIQATGDLKDLASNSSGSLPGGTSDPQDVSAMLDAGLRFAGNMTYQGGKSDIIFDGPDGTGSASTSATSGALGFAMGADGISYDVSTTGLVINALVPDIPFPLTLDMALSKFNFAMPLQKSDEEQDFALGFTMSDFTISDMIWGMLDPTAQLPRDPATLALDLSGKAKVLFDFMKPDQAAALESSGAAPGELNALTLKNLVVDAVGARLTGTGDFTFDNSDLASFGGMPRPKGAVDLKLVGGNGLLDKLVAVGVLPEQQAMGARLMMGLFAVAGTEADTLSSKIEINDEGHILANGQRIQ